MTHLVAAVIGVSTNDYQRTPHGKPYRHFTLGTASLKTGQAALKATIGITIPMGSKHGAMSTHNCVCQAANESFMELIAIDRDAPDPGRTRWFTLETPKTQAYIAERPRALCWVVNTSDLDAVVAASSVDLGEIVDFQRGDRTWRLTVPKDGSLPMGGLLPAFIEWSPGPHPSTGQQDLGIRQVKLTHPSPVALRSLLAEMNVDHLAEINVTTPPLPLQVSQKYAPLNFDRLRGAIAFQAGSGNSGS